MRMRGFCKPILQLMNNKRLQTCRPRRITSTYSLPGMHFCPASFLIAEQRSVGEKRNWHPLNLLITVPLIWFSSSHCLHCSSWAPKNAFQGPWRTTPMQEDSSFHFTSLSRPCVIPKYLGKLLAGLNMILRQGENSWEGNRHRRGRVESYVKLRSDVSALGFSSRRGSLTQLQTDFHSNNRSTSRSRHTD